MKLFSTLLLSILFFFSMFSQENNFEKGTTLYQQKQFVKAKPYFEKWLQTHPTDIKTQEYLGDIAGYQKQWDSSISYFEYLVKQYPKNANYHFKLGGVLALKAQASNKLKALLLVTDLKKHLHKAVILDPKHIEARWALVEVYVSLPILVGGSESKANKYANELLLLSPVDGYLALGYVAEYYNNPKKAETYYKKAIATGGSIHTYQKLSDLYEKNEQPQKALSNYEQAVKVKQRNHLNYLMGKVCAQYNLSLDKGLMYLKTYLKNYSAQDGVPKSWANFRIAQIYRHKKDKRNAYNYIQKALQEKPDLKLAIAEKKLILEME